MTNDNTVGAELQAEIGQIADADPGRSVPTTPVSNTATLLGQAQRRQTAAAEAVAEAALDVERARVGVVNAPGKASEQSLSNAKRRSTEAQDELEQAEVAVSVYGNRLFAEEHAVDLTAWAGASAEVAVVEVRGRHMQREVVNTLVRVANELEAVDAAARGWMAEADAATVSARGRTFRPSRGTVTPPSTLIRPWGQVLGGLEWLLRTLEGR